MQVALILVRHPVQFSVILSLLEHTRSYNRIYTLSLLSLKGF
jgi:hypothetical protein